MNNTVFKFNIPNNEPILAYSARSNSRNKLKKELELLSTGQMDIPLIIGGKEVRTGNTGTVVMPHNHQHILATYHKAGEKEISDAIKAAMEAKIKWMNLSWIERASISVKAAELISVKYRHLLNAATMLGQGKNIYQAEIDAACETIDFLRYNAYFASQIYADQPKSGFDQLNRLEYRPLEGFVFTVSPFNFTAIASNLNMAPVLMGNTTVWKPATTALLSNYILMKIFQEAGLPDGVINFIPGEGSVVGEHVLSNPDLGGIHFTGSNNTFNTLWKGVANNLEKYKSYPRIVGETGGKDFIVAHSSAVPIQVATAIVRGAFEYQGQKCSAASRAYLPISLWDEIKVNILRQLSEIKVGAPTDFSCFVNAVIDKKSYQNCLKYIDLAKNNPQVEIIAGGSGDDSKGFFIQPTILVSSDPDFTAMKEEIFGPIMTIYLYQDQDFKDILTLCDKTSPYALTGAIFANDRYAVIEAMDVLKYAAGNFYINDKPTGAMVGLQPFGGARMSGTNDKAGGPLNLLRWVTPRTIKETFVPATDFKYPFLKP